jgi:hypothetical protein
VNDALKKQKSRVVSKPIISSESGNNMSLADLNKEIIYWNPIRTGLLANFLNLKFVYHLSISLNKSVVINDTRNSLVFCTIFDLPPHVSCQKVPDVPCIQHSNLLNAIVTPTEEIFKRLLHLYSYPFIFYEKNVQHPFWSCLYSRDSLPGKNRQNA